MGMVDNEEMCNRLSEAIILLEERLKTISKEIPVFDNSEQTKFSPEWLTHSWQINMDINKIRNLIFEYQNNPRVVSSKQSNDLKSWLMKKYAIDISQ